MPRSEAPVADALASALRARGIDARPCDDLPPDATSVVFVGGLRRNLDDDAAIEVCRQALRAMRAFAPRALEGGGSFVTVQDTGGDFGLGGHDSAFLGGLAGLAKTADLEWPLASVKAIDLMVGERGDEQVADAIVAELLSGGPEIEVGLHDGRRLTPRSVLKPLEPETNPSAWQPAGVMVCSGGARGVTAATLIALARRGQRKIALLGRTVLTDESPDCASLEGEAELKRALMLAAKARGLPLEPAKIGAEVRQILAAREIRATMAALREAGAEVLYLATDVANRDSVGSALNVVRHELGPIRAFVHGAGVVADKNIVDKTEQQVERVLAPKIGGLRALLGAMRDDPLETIVLFSSVAGRTGNVGQSDYAMANEMLNKVAAREKRRRPGCLVKSLGWGPWEAGMVTPSLKAYFEANGVPLIPLEVGAQMMADELARADDEVELVLGGEPRRASIAGAARNHTFVVRVDRSSHPHLADHAIDGTVVLPVVQVLEWFTRAAEAVADGKRVASLDTVKVFRGVPLHGFDGEGDSLSLTCSRGSDSARLELGLCDISEPTRRYYRATAVLCDALPAATDTPAPEVIALADRLGPVYGDSLFHGPQLQVIRRVEGVAEEGIVGELDTTASRDWLDGPHRTDVAALDGGLQLALLWSQHCMGGRALPTGLARYERFTTTPPAGPLTCSVVGQARKPSTVSDITFRDAHGTVVARLHGVETHQRP